VQFGPGEWYATREEALARAEDIRADEIKSLKERIARIERMVF
jgi:hypothetical protein